MINPTRGLPPDDRGIRASLIIDMKVFARLTVLVAALSFATVAPIATGGRTAEAAVSIAVSFDALVLASHAIVIATPVDEQAQMEDGKIFTYTRLHVDTQIAGDAPTGSDVYVRAFGGVIDHIGMVSEGEPTFSVGKQQLLFLRHSVPGAYNVTADAQGQFVVEPSAGANTTGASPALTPTTQLRFRQSRATGLLLQPRNPTQSIDSAGASTGQSVRVTATPQLATEVICARTTSDVVRDIAAAYKRLHAR